MSDYVYTLVIGDKNLSSWSLRPWFLMRQAEIPFTEEKIRLRGADTRERILAHSPSGLVPALKTPHGTIWDSLAIAEYLNEQHRDKSLWPEDTAARAMARAVSAEMHSGFAALRSIMPMDFVNRVMGTPPGEAVARDTERIIRIWTECRTAYGAQGPFLFGRFSIADAMYAPVVSRFRTYCVDVEGAAAEYMETIWCLPAIREWEKGAAEEVNGG
ncbi:MAG: glutathione S-transferase family protein [Alphaproteobacteria bacterium]